MAFPLKICFTEEVRSYRIMCYSCTMSSVMVLLYPIYWNCVVWWNRKCSLHLIPYIYHEKCHFVILGLILWVHCMNNCHINMILKSCVVQSKHNYSSNGGGSCYEFAAYSDIIKCHECFRVPQVGTCTLQPDYNTL